MKRKEKTFTFVVDEKTKIMKGKNEIPFIKLKNGMHVFVEYRRDGEKMVATLIKETIPKEVKKREIR